MKDFIIIVLGMLIIILGFSSFILAVHWETINITDCEKYEHISGIKTASFDGTCYRFVNDKFVEVDFKELNNDR